MAQEPPATAFLRLAAGRNPAATLRRGVPGVARIAAGVGEEGSLWLLAPPAERAGAFVPWPWLLHDAVRDATGMVLRNVVVRVAPGLRGAKPFAPAHETLLWFVRDPARHAFDKDAVRVPHAFEHVEWGGRAQGRTGYHGDRLSARYSPGGRDPGNVLVAERRDAQAQVQGLDALPLEDVVRRLVLATTRSGWRVPTNLDPALARAALDGTGRRVERVEVGP